MMVNMNKKLERKEIVILIIIGLIALQYHFFIIIY